MKKPKTNRVLVGIAFTKEDHETIKSNAEIRRISISDFIRSSCFEKIHRERIQLNINSIKY